MTTRDPSRFVLVSQALARRAGAALLVCAAGGALFAGCGSDSSGSSNSEPFPEYEGVWAVDQDMSAIDCPNNPDLQNLAFSIWNSSFTIAAGVLSDIVEVQGTCQLDYAVDASKHIATLQNPDPYTNAAPTCQLTIDASTGENLVLTPQTDGDAAWTFKLLQPVAGQAPTAEIVGGADVVLKLANQVGAIETNNCKFVAQVSAHKVAKP